MHLLLSSPEDIFFIAFRERGREKGREREKNIDGREKYQSVASSCTSPDRGLCVLGNKPVTFRSRDDFQPTEPHRSGLNLFFLFKSSWYTTLYWLYYFQEYNVVIQHFYTLQYGHTTSSRSHLSLHNLMKILTINSILWHLIFVRFNFLICMKMIKQQNCLFILK